jgi:hypothetical protein
MAGGGASGHRQHRVAVGEQIGMCQRIAVDRAVGMRRHVDRRDEIARQHAAACLGERHRLFGYDRADPFLDQRERRIDGEQFAPKGEAIVAQLRHDPRPR